MSTRGTFADSIASATKTTIAMISTSAFSAHREVADEWTAREVDVAYGSIASV